ncbi:MAG: aminoacyl-tRNA hydrolase [Candidatus Aminicenantes bacterium]|nr:aminoacyl-tRNA hydrolase [Candidatus Aminicenantes bacterium]
MDVGRGISLEEGEIAFEFVRASGPGGQNVNKVATAVKLYFDVDRSPSLTEALKRRLRELAGRRIGSTGVLVIDARRFRTQEANRRDALERLRQLILRAAVPPRPRRPTRPSAAARARRMEKKKRRSTLKQARQKPHPGME